MPHFYVFEVEIEIEVENLYGALYSNKEVWHEQGRAWLARQICDVAMLLASHNTIIAISLSGAK